MFSPGMLVGSRSNPGRWGMGEEERPARPFEYRGCISDGATMYVSVKIMVNTVVAIMVKSAVPVLHVMHPGTACTAVRSGGPERAHGDHSRNIRTPRTQTMESVISI